MPGLNHIRRASFLGSVGVLLSAGVIGQVIMLAAMPIITRLYTPEDFGLLALFTGLLGASLVASSLRYELAIPLARHDHNAFALMVLALVLNGTTSSILFAAIALWGGLLSDVLDTRALATILWILPAAVLGAGSYRAFRLWAVRLGDFNSIAKTKIAQSLVLVLSQIGAGLLGGGGLGLALGHFLGLTAGAYRLLRTIDQSFLRVKARRQLFRIYSLAKRYSRFPRFDVAASLIDAIGVQLPNLLLAIMFSPTVAGSYLLADRILGTPLGLLSQSIAQVIYSRSRSIIQSAQTAAMTTKALLFLGGGASFPIIAVVLLCEPVFVVVFGETWRQAGIYGGWLIIGLFGQFLFSSVSLVLMAVNAQNINLFIHSLMFCVRLIALLYGLINGNALLSIIALSTVNFVGYLAAAGVVIWCARTHDIGSAASSTGERIS